MAATGVAEHVPRRSGAYWRDLVFSRLIPSLFFALFLARELVLLAGSLPGVHRPLDLLFVLQQALALAYFTMLVVLYAVRLPQRGTDHRLTVIFIAFSGTFAAISASFLPGGSRREGPRRDRHGDRRQPCDRRLAERDRDRLFHRLRAASHPVGGAHPRPDFPERVSRICKKRPPLPTQPLRSRLTGCASLSG